MAKTRKQKEEFLKKLKEKISKAISLVFVGYEKIKIEDQNNLRKMMKKEGGEFLVTKKKILNLALKDFKFENLENLKLDKEVALALGYNDEIVPAKIIVDFSKKNENIKIKGGIFDKKIVDQETVRFLASLPPKQVLQVQLLTNLQSPLTGLINALQANLRNLIYILNSLSKITNN